MADYVGQKIKELELASSINETDDLIIETSPASGTPVTKRTKLNTLAIFIKNILKIGDASGLQTTEKGSLVNAINELHTGVVNLGEIKIQFGTTFINHDAAGIQSLDIAFQTSYTALPSVIINPQTMWANNKFATASSITTTGFKAYLQAPGAGGTSINWIAIGT